MTKGMWVVTGSSNRFEGIVWISPPDLTEEDALAKFYEAWKARDESDGEATKYKLMGSEIGNHYLAEERDAGYEDEEGEPDKWTIVLEIGQVLSDGFAPDAVQW